MEEQILITANHLSEDGIGYDDVDRYYLAQHILEKLKKEIYFNNCYFDKKCSFCKCKTGRIDTLLYFPSWIETICYLCYYKHTQKELMNKIKEGAGDRFEKDKCDIGRPGYKSVECLVCKDGCDDDEVIVSPYLKCHQFICIDCFYKDEHCETSRGCLCSE